MPLSPFSADTRPEAFLSLARNARERAEEVLARAECFHDADARENRVELREAGAAARNGVQRVSREPASWSAAPRSVARLPDGPKISFRYLLLAFNT